MAEWHLKTMRFQPMQQERAPGTVINFLLCAVLTLQSAKSMFGLCFVLGFFLAILFYLQDIFCISDSGIICLEI